MLHRLGAREELLAWAPISVIFPDWMDWLASGLAHAFTTKVQAASNRTQGIRRRMLMPSAHGSARALLKATFVSEVFKDMVDQRFAWRSVRESSGENY